MSIPPLDQFRWRETYFVWFESKRRPQLTTVIDAVKELRGHFDMEHPEADGDGLLESLTVRSREDHSALEIDYTTGDDVCEEAAILAAELTAAGDEASPQRISQLAQCDARFEVMHFEQVPDGDEDPDELFDPSALLEVLGALVRLTDGVAVDPQSGSLI